MQGTIVGGAAGVVRAGTSIARAIQTGYLRAYALLLLIGVVGLVLYFLMRALADDDPPVDRPLPPARGRPGRRAPAGRGGALAVLASAAVAVLAYAIALLIDFEPASAACSTSPTTGGSRSSGIHYWLGHRRAEPVPGRCSPRSRGCRARSWRCFRDWDRPRLFFFNLALAETAVLGAFLAQDLALFVVFFDLMLVPFYFLIGGVGQRRPRARHHEVRDLHAGRARC